MIKFNILGNSNKTESYLEDLLKVNILQIMDSCGQQGVTALSLATPTESGLAAGSWNYEVGISDGSYSIYWSNTDVETDFPVAIMLQYGYSTGTGGYVQGRNYINPAIEPIFDMIQDRVLKAVISS